MEVGKTDVFERDYTERFRGIASKHGEFLRYERDRGARDIGLHLTRRTSDGRELLAPVTAWFQLKGVGAGTYTEAQFEAAESVPIVLEAKHLRYWYLQSEPTYLVLYVHSVEIFLIMELREYIKNTWGDDVLRLKQQHATVHVPKTSILDDQAFELIKFKRTATRWHELAREDEKTMSIALRDAHIISRVAHLDRSTREQSLLIRKYLSKLRMEVHFRERARPDGQWDRFHQHWQFMMQLEDVVAEFPYLRLTPLSDEAPGEEEPWKLTVDNGGVCYGEEHYGEAVDFECLCELNDLGQRLAVWIDLMLEAGVIELPTESTVTSQAPWHHRAV